MQSLRYHAPEAVRKAPVPETPGQACVLAIALLDTEIARIRDAICDIRGTTEEVAQKFAALQGRLVGIEDARYALEMVRLKSIGEPIPQSIGVTLALARQKVVESA